jgi:hypothetical protein
MIFAHELGHNLNLAHAGTDPENDGTINNVYGDYSDPMGTSSSSWYQFNAGHIDQMGWYAAIPDAVSTVLSGGSFDLAAIGADPNSAGNRPFALKIAKPDTGDFYYLSYRQAIGNYNQLSSTYTKGVNIHRYKGTGYAYTTHIKTLIDGETFTDNANGISVTQLAQGDGFATVQVGFGCAAMTPAVSVTPATLALRPGESVNFAIAVTNNVQANCGSTAFALSAGGNAAPQVTLSSFTLAPAQTGSSSLTAATGLAEGSYTLSVAASDDDGKDPQHPVNGQGSAVLIIDGTPPTAPGNLSGSVNRQGKVALSWQAASDEASGVAEYLIYRNGELIGQIAGTGFTDSGTAAGASYSNAVSVRDAAGNDSMLCDTILVTTASGKGGGKK